MIESLKSSDSSLNTESNIILNIIKKIFFFIKELYRISLNFWPPVLKITEVYN